jgi:branched-chain amino acid transport system substrate-binding protein
VSYELEPNAVVRYPMKLQRMPVRQIAAAAEQDSRGDAGFAGVPKAVRTLSVDESAMVRFNCKPNTLDADDAVKRLKARTLPFEAVVTVPNRAATKRIEKTRDLFAAMSDVQGTALGPQLDTEQLIDVPANMRNLDLGAGTALNFGRTGLQISPGIWGSAA